MKSLLLRFFSWIAKIIGGLLKEEADKQDSKGDSKTIDKADDHIKDVKVDVEKRKDNDAFDNKNW